MEAESGFGRRRVAGGVPGGGAPGRRKKSRPGKPHGAPGKCPVLLASLALKLAYWN